MLCAPLGSSRPTVAPATATRPDAASPEPRDSFSRSPGVEPPPGTAWAAPRKDPPGPREERALQKEREQQDRLQAQEIYARMRADRRLWQARLAALMADLQTEIHRIFQEVLLRRRKVQDEVLKAWHKVLVDG